MARPLHEQRAPGEAHRQGVHRLDAQRRGATSIAPYSLRARSGARVSMPLSWEELDEARPTPSRCTTRSRASRATTRGTATSTPTRHSSSEGLHAQRAAEAARSVVGLGAVVEGEHAVEAAIAEQRAAQRAPRRAFRSSSTP
ncbi:MAG: hypothetical protein ACLSVD_01985 [Eggerthellaceae bacterium]